MEPFAQFASNVAYIARDRRRQLVVAVGAAAVAIAIVSKLASKLLESLDLGASGGEPKSLVVVAGIVLVAWAVKVALLALLFAVVTATLADRDSPGLTGWLPAVGPTLPSFAKVAAATTVIAPVLLIWTYQGAVSMLNKAKEASDATALASLSSSPPLPVRTMAFFADHALAKLLVLGVLGTAWLAFSTRRALALRTAEEGPLAGPTPVVTAGLAFASLLVSGVVLGSTAGGFANLMPGFTASDGILGSMVGVFFATVVTGAVIAAWNIAYDPELAAASRAGELPLDALAGDPSHEAATAAAGDAAHPPAYADPSQQQAPPAFQQVDSIVDAVPDAPAGAWWFVRAGGSVLIEVAGQGAQPQPIVQGADGSWHPVQPGAHPAAGGFLAPADAWYLLGAWLTDGVPQQVRIRLTLPADAQAAPAAA
ncbi:MAG: hypothetical protein JWN72_860 [Thermoleophilia bacterium]|nr:hypothetical protein [Thermoleophilia bacterium]